MSDTPAAPIIDAPPPPSIEEQLATAIRQRDAAILGLREAAHFAKHINRVRDQDPRVRTWQDAQHQKHLDLLASHLEAAGEPPPAPMPAANTPIDQADGATA